MAVFHASLAALLLLVTLVTAQQSGGDTLSIFDDSDKYKYYGSYNETTEVEGSAHTRALVGGINESSKNMTVPTCLDFCSNGDTEYR